jgi:hypothetical protein
LCVLHCLLPRARLALSLLRPHPPPHFLVGCRLSPAN